MRYQKGFLIFEVLVALVILSVGMIATIRSFGQVFEVLERTNDYFYAGLIGEEVSLHLRMDAEKVPNTTYYDTNMLKREKKYKSNIRTSTLDIDVPGFSVNRHEVRISKGNNRLMSFPTISFIEDRDEETAEE